MKVLILSSKMPYPLKDGGAIAVYMLAKGLVNAGASVTTLALNTRKHWVSPNSIPVDVKNSIGLIPIDIKTNISFFDALINLLFSKKPYVAQRFYKQKVKNVLERVLRSNSFDIIQIDGLYVTPYLPHIRQNTTAHISYRAHNVESLIWTRLAKNQTRGFKRWYYGILARRIQVMEQKLVNRYDAFLPITTNDAHWFSMNGNNKPFIVIPVGFDKPSNANNSISATHPSNIAFLGSLDWPPNQEGLLWFIEMVWPLVYNIQPKIQLHVAGRNAPQWLENRIVGTEGVHYHGEVDDATRFILNFPVIAVPLLSGSGMRVKIVEAMLLGRVVVSTTVGAEGIAAEDGVSICIADHPKIMAETIVELSVKPAKTMSISDKALLFAKENFDGNNIGKNLFDFYNSLLNDNT